MCVKTKTEWSCGCYKKALSTCEEARDSRTPCFEVDKYRYLDDGDCNDCRAGGANVTRGQDRLGRYALEIASREKKAKKHSRRAILGEITGNGSHASQANHEKAPAPIVTPDPWMKATRREKEWESPHRRHADEEWEREHARRKEDIESLAQSHSASPKPRFHSRRTTAPAEFISPYEAQTALVLRHSRRASGSMQNQVKQISNTMSRMNRPQHSRHGSIESIESMPSRGRSRTLPYQYGYASDFGYAVETRAPREVYDNIYNTPPPMYGRR